MAFDPERCYIPTVYCGTKEKKYPYYENDNKYIQHGSPFQCMKKGFGAATARENKKRIPQSSLQNIRYIGPYFEEEFKKEGITTISQLISFARRSSANQIENTLTRVFRNRNGSLNGKGYNSILLFLYRNGNNRLPHCEDLD